MRTIKTVLCICTAGMLAGCAEVPSAVQQEISVLDQIAEQSTGEDAAPQYQTLDEIRAGLSSLPARNTRIVQLLDAPVLPAADSMPTCQLAPFTLSEAEAEACFSQVRSALGASLRFTLPDAKWDHLSSPLTEISAFDKNGSAYTIDLSAHNWTLFQDGLCALCAGDTASLGITLQGAVCNFWQTSDPPIYATNLPALKSAPVGYDSSTLSESFAMMNGEEWQLSDAKAFAEDFYNSTFGSWGGQVSFAVKEIRVLKLPEGGFGYDITLQQIYGGSIPLLPLQSPDYQNASPEHVIFGKTCSMWCIEPNRVQSLSMDGLYRLTPGAENPQLLSAESALDTVAAALAQKKTHTVHMELGYACVLSGSEYMQLTGDLSNISIPLENGDYESCSAVPYWFIWEPVAETKPRMSGDYYMVNALTGELEIL